MKSIFYVCFVGFFLTMTINSKFQRKIFKGIWGTAVDFITVSSCFGCPDSTWTMSVSVLDVPGEGGWKQDMDDHHSLIIAWIQETQALRLLWGWPHTYMIRRKPVSRAVWLYVWLQGRDWESSYLGSQWLSNSWFWSLIPAEFPISDSSLPRGLALFLIKFHVTSLNPYNRSPFHFPLAWCEWSPVTCK